MRVEIPVVSLLIGVGAAAGVGVPIPEAWAEGRPVRAGEPAPVLAAYNASGSIVAPEDLHGKTVLLTFWSTADKAHRRHIDRLAKIRQEFADEPGFLMVTIHVVKDVQSDHDDWLEFLDERGTVSYPDAASVRFDSDPRWWQVFEAGDEDANARVRASYGVTDTPRSFLIRRDGKIVAANVPLGQLRETVARYFDNPRETSAAADEEGGSRPAAK